MILIPQVVKMATAAYKKTSRIKSKIVPILLAGSMAAYITGATGATGASTVGTGSKFANDTLTIEAAASGATSLELSDFDASQGTGIFNRAITAVKNLTLSGNFAQGFKITATKAATLDIGELKINKGQTIKGGFEINPTTSIVNADIINQGTIEGGVAIGEANKAFPLRAATTGDVANFTNNHIVKGGFDIKGITATGTTTAQPDANPVKTFHLTNNSGGVIKDNIALANNNPITAGATALKFNLTNHGAIYLPVATNVNTLMDITEYHGKSGSELYLDFSGALTQHTGGIVAVGTATFANDAKIILCSEGKNKATNATANTAAGGVELLEATGKITITDGTISDVLYTKAFDNKIIWATPTVAAKEVKADLQVVDVGKYFPQNAILNKQVAKKIATSKTITTALESTPTVGNLEVTEVFAHIGNFQGVFDKAMEELGEDTDAIIDAVMPDCSNVHLTVGSVVYDKLTAHISARVSGKSISSPYNSDSYGISSGELDENLGIWAAFSYLIASESENKDKQDFGKSSTMLFSVGVDTMLSDFTLGLSYGFNKSNTDIKGGLAGKNKGDRSSNHHAITAYGAYGIEDVDINLAATYAFASHKGKDYIKDVDHSGGIFGLNAAVTYALEVADGFDVDLGGSVAFNYISADEHDNKFNSGGKVKAKTPKSSNSVLKLGLIAGIKDITPVGDAMHFDYNVSIGYKLTFAMGEDKQKITLQEKQGSTAAVVVEVTGRKPSMHKFALDAALGLRVTENIRLGVDLNLGIGQKLMEYGASFVARYTF